MGSSILYIPILCVQFIPCLVHLVQSESIFCPQHNYYDDDDDEHKMFCAYLPKRHVSFLSYAPKQKNDFVSQRFVCSSIIVQHPPIVCENILLIRIMSSSPQSDPFEYGRM